MSIPAEAHHDWRALVGYKLTDEQAYRLAAQQQRPGAPPLVPIHPDERALVDPLTAVLDVDQVDRELSHIVCMRCEVAHQAAHGVPCPGDPIEYDRRTGEPIYEVRNTATGDVRRVVWDRWVEMHG